MLATPPYATPVGRVAPWSAQACTRFVKPTALLYMEFRRFGNGKTLWPGGAPLLWLGSGFHQALQRVLVRMCRLLDHFDFRGGNVARIHTAYTATFVMDFQHDACGIFRVLAKYALQDHDDEFHGGVVVIEQDHLIHGRWCRTRCLPVKNGGGLISCLGDHIQY